MNGIDEQLEDAIWEICANQLLSIMIDLFHQNEQNKHWKKIIIRVIVFFNNELNGMWGMTMREYVYSMPQAQQLYKAFSKEKEKQVWLAMPKRHKCVHFQHFFS